MWLAALSACSNHAEQVCDRLAPAMSMALFQPLGKRIVRDRKKKGSMDLPTSGSCFELRRPQSNLMDDILLRPLRFRVEARKYLPA